MRFLAVATDYDGTLAHDGMADPAALEALRQLRKSGRRSILVTGRILSELRTVLPELEIFDAIVAENGAVLYDPALRETQALAPAPPPAFIEALQAKGVSPLDAGEVIVSTWHPHETTVLETIRELGLDLTVIFNKGAVMVLPSNVNKATGLGAQARALGISLHSIAGIGDAENDLAFLTQCEVSVATANALESVKDACDFVTAGNHGAGVAELVESIIADDLRGIAAIDRRHAIDLGTSVEGEPVAIGAGSGGVLLAGTSGGGKTTLVTGFVERLDAQGYQFCIADPEGDYDGLEGAIGVGDAHAPPTLDAIANVIAEQKNAVVSLLAVPQPDRPAFAHSLLARVAELRATTGRPHWLIVDEAHHAFPAQSEALPPVDVGRSVFFITTRPELVAKGVLTNVDVVIAVGDEPGTTIASARTQLDRPEPAVEIVLEHAHTGTAVVWRSSDPGRAQTVTTIPGAAARRRHLRKYAEGDLGPEKAFFFTGPAARQNLRAQNLMVFNQLADGVDDETWTYHLGRHDYSQWIGEAIGDSDLRDAVRTIEDDGGLDTRASRNAVIAAVRERYTTPG